MVKLGSTYCKCKPKPDFYKSVTHIFEPPGRNSLFYDLLNCIPFLPQLCRPFLSFQICCSNFFKNCLQEILGQTLNFDSLMLKLVTCVGRQISFYPSAATQLQISIFLLKLPLKLRIFPVYWIITGQYSLHDVSDQQQPLALAATTAEV